MQKIKGLLKKDQGFTLIEMLIVLVIISILLLIVVPNLSKNQELANDKGCEATIKMLETQVVAYQIDKGAMPATLKDLETEGYVSSVNCPSGNELVLINGKISVKE